ncbi:MAG: hypothetical protein UU08_C0008G0022 [Candidatus Uhrbacteria bacterium GW2011_GWE2_40_58]|nr:MAG: hypothetical protein UT94_C0008G0022 [Candidatus Uhrbacteria bacterium GW2011_GWF2_40_263]KKR67816.1 MAG: hypothetical protein UU08_C0008G0022 [Candidatus Uhrbacteria bacterium GW2011_GWE2_40_58]OGL94523.1 MAG: hypothetical protein A2239_00550 [Candidatus Uhrbacteria bacterium RIFOXYA2_FULL_40_9]OGL96774.1 MAG: hypothetical protein A2332_04525 [Candidatus Uhrbacteria bacterium RIFOXYB2_FULL_41_18]HBK34490.1 hypothetical protein [Candidatus Uhrbacteria bacterium]
MATETRVDQTKEFIIPQRGARTIDTDDVDPKTTEPEEKSDKKVRQIVPSDAHLLRRIHPDPKWIALRDRLIDLFVRRIRTASNAMERNSAEFPLKTLLEHLGSEHGQQHYNENIRQLAHQLITALRSEVDVKDPIQFHRRFLDVDGMPTTT